MTNEEIENLVNITDIVSLVSQYVNLEKQGKNYQGLCPFHNEKTPSFVVSTDKKIFKCFGCGKAGGPIKFIEEIEHLEYKDALHRLADFNGIKLSDTYKKKEDPNKRLYDLMNASKDFYKMYLNKTKEGLNAIKYLEDRGLTKEIIEDFSIGLSPDFGDTLYKMLSEMGFKELDMFDAGLIERDKNGKIYDLFSNRIMFPIFNEFGNVVAYSARIYKESKDKKDHKYINSRETVIFKKGEVLFNFDKAKLSINKMHRVILHEGQMDVIASNKAGFTEAVCTLGTSLSKAHVDKLSKLTKSVVICYDGDFAGRNASVKAIKLFESYGFDIHLVLLPDGLDPDDYIKKYGIEKYKEYFNNNQIDKDRYLFNVLFFDKNLNDSNVLKALMNDAFELIASFNSMVEEERYLDELSKRINASIDAIKNDYANFKKTYWPAPQKAIVEKEEKKPKPISTKKFNSICEFRIIKYAQRSKVLALQIDEAISNSMDGMSQETQELWTELIYSYYENFETFDEGRFINMISEECMNHYMYLNEELKKDITKYNDDDLGLCVEKIKSISRRISNKRLKEIAKNSADITEKSRLTDQIISNRRRKK